METKTTYILKHLLFTGLLVFMLFPLIQQGLKLFEERGLEGAFSPAPNIQLSSSAWLSGEFQEKKDLYLNEHFGFRKTLVRLYNQIDYSLFGESNAEKTAVGQDGFLFENDYIRSSLGLDFMGETNLKIKIQKLKAVRDTLESMGKDFIFVFAASKGTYYPEYFPLNYKDSVQSKTNYELFSQKLKENNFNLLDLNQWFLNAKDTTKVPLFTKTGIHWSKYGEYLVMDTMMKYVAQIRGEKLPRLVLDEIQSNSDQVTTDDDIERSLNLMIDIPDFDDLVYPAFHFEMDNANPLPKALTIGDSFYWGIHNAGLTQNIYDEGDFWYYFETVYPNRIDGSSQVADLNLKEELDDFDMVILMCTEINIYCFGFIEETYDAYFSGDETQLSIERINEFIEAIKNDKAWYAKVVLQAEEKGITVEECLRENAEYMVFQESLE